jgi:predicted RNase H-like HicB family nuclease
LNEYVVVIEQEGSTWGAYCPDLPGVGVVADSRDEAESLIREALELHLEELRASGEPIPQPTTVGSTRIRVSTS